LIGDPDHFSRRRALRVARLRFSSALPDRQPLLPGNRLRDPVDLGAARECTGRTNVLEIPMRSEYDFSKSRKNPYAKQLKRQVTIRLDTAAVDYFKKMAAEMGMPYQNLINLFLRDCAIQKRRPVIQWPPEKP
jgi:uncharacterized protein (DUF4415 family)